MKSLRLIGVLCTLNVICALPAQDDRARSLENAVQTEGDLLEAVHADCLQRNTLACIKYKIYNFVENTLNRKDSVTVTDGLQVVKTETDTQDASARALSADDTIETVIFSRIQRFINSHSIKYELKGTDVVNTVDSAARSFGLYDNDDDELVEEGRGKKKKIKKVVKTLGPLLPLLAMKGAMMMKLGVAAVALIAGKAFMVAKIALLLSVLNGLSKLMGGGGGGGGHHEVEVVAHHGGGHDGGFHDGGGHGHGGWARTIQAQQLAYRGHEQPTH